MNLELAKMIYHELCVLRPVVENMNELLKDTQKQIEELVSDEK